ncbi:MAG TPA: helix-turn-helix domain-containing protein [Pseudolabrys sp.]|nr:helix-turn-helix domain-containing protein [Pseudolabrys sp.]
MNDRNQSEAEFLPTAEAAKLLGLAAQTLASDRVNGRLGIPFNRFGRAVRYQRRALMEWAAGRRIEIDAR